MQTWVVTLILFIVMLAWKYFNQPAADPNAKANGEAWLKAKESEPGVYKLPSGMLFKILNKGTGTESPLVSTRCSCHYEGTLINGKVFDSSYRRGKPIDFAPNQVIKGWTEALQLMREGDKWEVYIPYQLAYGSSGAGADIPGYSALIFKMEIVQIKGQGTRPVADVDATFENLFGKKYADM